jgi:hypothetical protein
MDETGRITASDVKKFMEMRKEEVKRNKTSPDLAKYLDSLDWELRNRRSSDDYAFLFNMTFFLGNQYEMVHQGDINSEVLKGIRKRISKIKDKKLYIFREGSENLPICGPFDGTALRFDKGMAKPLGKENVGLEFADIVLESDGTATLNYDFLKPENVGKALEKVGWKVEYRRI